MTNRRVAILCRDTGLFGGIERQIFMLARGLKQKGYTVYFIADNLETKLARELMSIGVSVKALCLKNLWKAGKEIAEYCKDNQINILQSHMLKESFIARFAKIYNKKIKHIFRVHTYIDCSHISKIKKDIYHLASKLTDFLVDYYLSINEYNVKELIGRTHIKKQKIKIIHDAVAAPPIKKETILGLEKKNNIAMIANFYPFKGHDILVKGIKILKDEGIIVHATILGGEAYAKGEDQTPVIMNEIIELSNSLGIREQVTFRGFVNNIYENILDIPIIVLPSYMEGTPNCLLEAMSLGKIVVASNVGGVPEFVVDGENGFTHIPGSPQHFVNALKKALFIDDEQSYKIRENAYKTWLNEFSEKCVIEEYARFISNRTI